MVFKLSRMFKRPINKVPAPTLVELPYTPNPGWSHGRAPAGSDTFEDFFGRTITKISVCTYEDPRVPGLSIWRIYAVLDDPNEMIEVEWQLSRHSIPKIMFTYRVTSEIEAELAVANRIDFAIHESPRSRKPYTFYELYLTIIRNGLHTALASKSITSAQFEEFFSTWALTLVGALYRAGRVVPSAVQALAIEIWQSWTQGEVGSCPDSVSARPVAFINTRANEIRDMVCDIMYTSCEF